MVRREVTVQREDGLEARPIAVLVQKAKNKVVSHCEHFGKN